jgi:hypothetical protein
VAKREKKILTRGRGEAALQSTILTCSETMCYLILSFGRLDFLMHNYATSTAYAQYDVATKVMLFTENRKRACIVVRKG